MAFPTSNLSQENILRDIHDPSTQTIRTSATAIIPSGLVVDIDHTDDSIAIGTATDLFTSTTIGPKIGLDVNVINNSSALPANAATESTLNSVLLELQQKTEPSDAQNIRTLSNATDSILVPGVAQETTLSSIDAKITTTVDGINITLPLNAATATLQTAGNNILTNIDNKLPVLGQHPSAGSVSVVLANDQTLSVITDIDAFSSTPDNIMTVGTDDGTKTGVKYGFVNNLRQQILASADREQDITYADFGTKNQRVTVIDYNSATFPGSTVRRVFAYTLVGNNYRRDSETWTIV